MAKGPEIFVTIRKPLYGALFSKETDAELRSLGHVRFNELDRDLTSAELAARIIGADACLTGWDPPLFDETVLEAADRLKIIAHSAGTVKFFLPEAVFQRGIVVTQAAAGMAPAVAEFSVFLALYCLRKMFDHNLNSPEWFDSCTADYVPGHELTSQRVGIVGTSHCGREAIKRFKALEAEVWVYDPYLSEEEAASLGVTKHPLDELMADCRVISLHAPTTDETRHMIGRRQLALMQGEAVLVNTARAWLVDSDALLAELKTGRISAGLDVFDEEPLPPDDPLRNLPNVVLTSHMAGVSKQARAIQAKLATEELRRFFNGEPPLYPVTLDRLPIMA